MNREDLRNRCRSRFRDVLTTVYDDAEWNAYLNEALADVVNASPWWPWAEQHSNVITVPAGTDQIGLTVQLTDAVKVHTVWNRTDEMLLQPISREQAFRRFPITGTDTVGERGTPAAYRTQGNLLYVYPTPETATDLIIEYSTGAWPDLDSDSAVPPFAERYHPMLIDGALARAYTDDGNVEQSTIHQGRFDKTLANLMHEMLSGRPGGYHALVDNWWG